MTPGELVRRMLGPAFPVAGEAYRRIFVDMRRVVAAMSPLIPQNAHVLDVGGGDGYVVDLLLSQRPDVRVTMTDIAPAIGSFIRPHNRARVELRPQTDVSEVAGSFNAIIIADVVHHVPAPARQAFFRSIADAAERTGCKAVLVKDIRPGNVRALLSLWADLYITGDKNVSLVSEDEIELPGFTRRATLMPDFPNYCVLLARQ